MQRKNGYSLIELLVVITIIGILATIGLMSYRTANQKARDSRRESDVQSIQSSLEVYRSDQGEYPEDIYSDTEFYNLFTTNVVPVDPQGGNYIYSSISPFLTYTLTYTLENGGNPLTKVVDNP